MTGTVAGSLYLRSRRVWVPVAGLALLHVIGATLGAQALDLRLDESPGSGAAVPWLTVLPLVAACLIGLSVRSPFYELDAVAARRMPAWRLGQVVVLGVAAAASTLALTRGLDGPHAQLSGIRNLAGFLGLALLGGRYLHGRLSWLPPVLWAATAMMLGHSRPYGFAWDWPVRYDIDYGAFVFAVLLFAAGLVAASGGTRETRGDVDG